jgi:hypothetical protein
MREYFFMVCASSQRTSSSEGKNRESSRGPDKGFHQIRAEKALIEIPIETQFATPRGKTFSSDNASYMARLLGACGLRR